jgi:hypothetical protein
MTTFVIVAVSERKQQRTANDPAVPSYVERSAGQEFRGGRTSMADNSLQRTAETANPS